MLYRRNPIQFQSSIPFIRKPIGMSSLTTPQLTILQYRHSAECGASTFSDYVPRDRGMLTISIASHSEPMPRVHKNILTYTKNFTHTHIHKLCYANAYSDHRYIDAHAYSILKLLGHYRVCEAPLNISRQFIV